MSFNEKNGNGTDCYVCLYRLIFCELVSGARLSQLIKVTEECSGETPTFQKSLANLEEFF